MQSIKSCLMVLVGLGSMPALAGESVSTQQTWLDKGHHHAKNWLSSTVNHMDNWFGDSNKEARIKLRVMLDSTWNEYDGTTIKPRVRAKVRLPSLEDRLSVVFGDENLDNEMGGGIYNDDRVARPNTDDRAFDRRRTKDENSSLALRWSKFRKNAGLDVDLGVRSDDVFVRLKAEKSWQLPHNIDSRFEQVYRYGSQSEHMLLSTLEFSQPQSDTRTLINRSHLHYTNHDGENLNWSNSLYQQHDWAASLGTRSFSYGLYTGGEIIDKKSDLNVWGPYLSYRQPVWRDWLFVQGDASYYNNKSQDKDHHIALFSRVEAVF